MLILVSNALKFTFNGGVTIKVYQKDNKVVVEVIDTGIGIQEHELPNLFKLFGSIKFGNNSINKNGIGLGLVIAKMIVEKFDGEIKVYSEYGKGTTFKFFFETEVCD